MRLDRLPMGDHFGAVTAKRGQRVGLKAEPGQLFDRTHLRRGQRRADFAPGIGEKLQRAGAGDFGIELAQRTGGGIARIGENPRALARIQRREIGMGHIDLAPDFQDLGRIAA